MAMANNRKRCFTCSRENNTYTCEGCSKRFCSIHIPEHQQILNEELHHIINDYNQFKQRINEQKQYSYNYSLIEQIDHWERNSIEIIQQKAKDCREIVIKSSRPCINDIEKKFNNLNEQIKQIHSENDFNESNLIYLRNQLIKITQALDNSLNIHIQEDSKSFINEIAIVSEKKPQFSKWKQNSITAAGGNIVGQKLNQFNCPAGIFIDKKKNIFIADCSNHRIV
ncbi:unnamed protein product [Adineta steineri]|uniref:B box-type domain-containing protein n=1 Tax=Adineta steineri TaxID=433720 RepID=A0A813UWS1_9BILA|nr:unnamed protein product [Adineta steineri]CAF1129179.1 unnamed protein product [Adineta steineri]CAF3557716.1 unnamed protein product [Adineta steineri]CAF3720940.1 unnamed protein product [Adineta steineri]